MPSFYIKRIYDEPSKDDGLRVLVDRLWPRGMKKERAALDRWEKSLAPSPELRKWWSHDPERMDEFATAYQAELDASGAAKVFVEGLAPDAKVTLLFAAKDLTINHAAILKDYLTQLAAHK